MIFISAFAAENEKKHSQFATKLATLVTFFAIGPLMLNI